MPGETERSPRAGIGRVAWHVVLVMTLRCESADLIRIRSRHGESSFTERLAERLHRLICHTCRRGRKQNRVVDDSLKAFANRELRRESRD